MSDRHQSKDLKGQFPVWYDLLWKQDYTVMNRYSNKWLVCSDIIMLENQGSPGIKINVNVVAALLLCCQYYNQRNSRSSIKQTADHRSKKASCQLQSKRQQIINQTDSRSSIKKGKFPITIKETADDQWKEARKQQGGSYIHIDLDVIEPSLCAWRHQYTKVTYLNT